MKEQPVSGEGGAESDAIIDIFHQVLQSQRAGSSLNDPSIEHVN